MKTFNQCKVGPASDGFSTKAQKPITLQIQKQSIQSRLGQLCIKRKIRPTNYASSAKEAAHCHMICVCSVSVFCLFVLSSVSAVSNCCPWACSDRCWWSRPWKAKFFISGGSWDDVCFLVSSSSEMSQYTRLQLPWLDSWTGAMDTSVSLYPSLYHVLWKWLI